MGLLYRQFYQHTDQGDSSPTISIVRPHSEYTVPVWDQHVKKDQDLLERTQKFACKMNTKNWDKGYNELLYMTNLPSLADRRLYLKLCSMYKIVHNLSHQILLYLKSPDRIPAHLLPCTTLLHILCFIFLTLLYLMLYHNGTHFQSHLFQLPPLQLFNTHLQCITLSNYI